MSRQDRGPSRIVFTTLLRHDLSEALGYEQQNHFSGNSTKDRLAFLKNVDWDDPYNMDKAVRTYIGWVVGMVNEQLTEQGAKPIHMSWGAPVTDADGKLKRPQLRIMVEHEEMPEENYMLSFTPPAQEEAMKPETRKVLDMIRQTIERDMGMAVDDAQEHPVPKQHNARLEPDEEFKKKNTVRVEMRNMYEGEGKTWDLHLPSRELAERLKEVICGKRDISHAHVPQWYS